MYVKKDKKLRRFFSQDECSFMVGAKGSLYLLVDG